MPTSTVEDYLKAILVAEDAGDGELVSTGEIAARLEVAPGTVTAMIKTLAESGLLVYEPYSGVRLTEAGRQLAVHVLRRHRLIELFLVQIMRMDWSEVHGEAERLEHVVSEALIDRIDEMLGHPSVDPHGDPIPDASGVVEETDVTSLLYCPVDTPLRVARVLEQTPEFLQFLERRGLRPGSELTVTERNEPGDTVELGLGDGSRLDLGYRAASKILVAVTSPSLVD